MRGAPPESMLALALEVLRRCVVTISGWQIAGPVDEPHPALAPRRLRLGSSARVPAT